jgi:hypothetical protein
MSRQIRTLYSCSHPALASDNPSVPLQHGSDMAPIAWPYPECHEQGLRALLNAQNRLIALINAFQAVIASVTVARQPGSTAEACNTMADWNEAHTNTFPSLLHNFNRASQVVRRDFVERATRANAAAQTLGPFELPAPALPRPNNPSALPRRDADA